ncbi:septum formation family protein, partial [Kineococcus glutinatus]|uniref:septum formation family protein n=1 Tax=Kineococcus glutinatus TaxID=1070872 RepID=UPI0031EBC49B
AVAVAAVLAALRLLPLAGLAVALLAGAAGYLLTAAAGRGGGTVVGVHDLRIGDCYQFPDEAAEAVATVETVPCTSAHDAEVVTAFDLPAGDFPGEEEVQRTAEQRCGAFVAGPVTAAAGVEGLAADWFAPTEEGWDLDGDRTVLCGAYADRPLRAPLVDPGGG